MNVRAPKLLTCIAVYYTLLFLLGVAQTILGSSMDEVGVLDALGGGLWMLFLTHLLLLAIVSEHNLMTLGPFFVFLTLGWLATTRLTGLFRNLAVVGLLLVANTYSLAIVSM